MMTPHPFRFSLLLLLCMFLLFPLSASAGKGEKVLPEGSGYAGLEDLCSRIDRLGVPETVDLEGVPLPVEDRKALLSRYPGVRFLWTMELWGTEVSSLQDSVTLSPGNSWISLPALEVVLDCMPSLKSVNLFDGKIRLKDADELIARYPGIDFGLTLKLNEAHTIRTDMTAFSTLGRSPHISRTNAEYFRYLKGLRALDVGHMFLKDAEFLRSCSKLKVLIIADCGVADLSPLRDQEELEYLEAFHNGISDLTPLSSLKELRDLNIGYNRITDLSPLYDLPRLERVWLMGNWDLSAEEVDRLREHLPGCQIVTRSYGATGNLLAKERGEEQIPGTSWRHHPHYDSIYWMFHHDEYISWDVPVPQVKTEADP